MSQWCKSPSHIPCTLGSDHRPLTRLINCRAGRRGKYSVRRSHRASVCMYIYIHILYYIYPWHSQCDNSHCGLEIISATISSGSSHSTSVWIVESSLHMLWAILRCACVCEFAASSVGRSRPPFSVLVPVKIPQYTRAKSPATVHRGALLQPSCYVRSR